MVSVYVFACWHCGQIGFESIRGIPLLDSSSWLLEFLSPSGSSGFSGEASVWKLNALPSVSHELSDVLMIIACWIIPYRTKMFGEAVQGLDFIKIMKSGKRKHFGRTLVFGRLVRCRTIDERCWRVVIVRIDQGDHLSELDGIRGSSQSF